MADSQTLARATWTVDLPNRRRLVATADLVHRHGNERPYFSLTGEERNLRKRGDNQVEAGGCIHDEIVEQWPHLAPLAAIHLSDDRGVPMHAVGNGLYWLGFTAPYGPPGGRSLVKFARLWRIDIYSAQEIHAEIGHLHPEQRTEALGKWALLRAHAWATEAAEALSIIRAQEAS